MLRRPRFTQKPNTVWSNNDTWEWTIFIAMKLSQITSEPNKIPENYTYNNSRKEHKKINHWSQPSLTFFYLTNPEYGSKMIAVLQANWPKWLRISCREIKASCQSHSSKNKTTMVLALSSIPSLRLFFARCLVQPHAKQPYGTYGMNYNYCCYNPIRLGWDLHTVIQEFQSISSH